MLNDQVGQLWDDTEDRVESRPEPMKPTLEGLQGVDLEDGGVDGARRLGGVCAGDAPGYCTVVGALNSYTVGGENIEDASLDDENSAEERISTGEIMCQLKS